ncbi:MAG: hypothetical protein ACLFVJ_19015 [Persicimonas sp.]
MSAAVGVVLFGLMVTDGFAEPMTYRFNDPNPRINTSVYSVYQADDITLMTRHPEREEPQFDNPSWFATEATDGRMVRGHEAQRPVLVKPDAGDYRPGAAEKRGGPESSWTMTYDDLDTEWVRGDDDREIAGQPTEHHILKVSYRGTREAAGSKDREESFSYEHHFWSAPQREFSPAFAVPFRLMGRLFVDDDSTRLGEYIFESVREELSKKGLVLRVEFRVADADKPKYTLEVDRLEPAEQRSVELPSHPIVDEQTFARITSATMVSRMIEPSDPEAARESRFEVEFGGELSGASTGRAVYGVNEHGDFTLLLSFTVDTDEGQGDSGRRKLSLLLMRPMHGQPTAGDYEVENVADDIDALSKEQLQELSKFFTVMAVVRQDKADGEHPDVYALLDADDGELTIADDEEALSGEIDLKLRGLCLSEEAREVKVEIRGSFDAKEGLDNVGSSRITQVLSRD